MFLESDIHNLESFKLQIQRWDPNPGEQSYVHTLELFTGSDRPRYAIYDPVERDIWRSMSQTISLKYAV